MGLIERLAGESGYGQQHTAVVRGARVMARWALLAEQHIGTGEGRDWSIKVLGHVEGTREEAVAALREHAEKYKPQHPLRPKRRALYRDGDSFLLVQDGSWQVFHCRFMVAEQLYDSAV
ncbi:hypothetical protein ACFYZ4_29040 [Streptomyces sp. NPDC001513]|uniref:hypothetical protein n=1 Tax=Streptomyces sp. NPDC001513 TaxID=3364580 RepID=UPI0036C1F461